MELLDGRYYPIHFEDVSSAVNYCGALVPYVVERLRSGEREGIEHPAIWFSANRQPGEKSVGCDLLMTRGAVLAAVAGGLRTPAMTTTSRTLLPPGAVLVLGEDSHEAPLIPPVRRRMPMLHASPRLNQRSA